MLSTPFFVVKRASTREITPTASRPAVQLFPLRCPLAKAPRWRRQSTAWARQERKLKRCRTNLFKLVFYNRHEHCAAQTQAARSFAATSKLTCGRRKANPPPHPSLRLQRIRETRRTQKTMRETQAAAQALLFRPSSRGKMLPDCQSIWFHLKLRRNSAQARKGRICLAQGFDDTENVSALSQSLPRLLPRQIKAGKLGDRAASLPLSSTAALSRTSAPRHDRYGKSFCSPRPPIHTTTPSQIDHRKDETQENTELTRMIAESQGEPGSWFHALFRRAAATACPAPLISCRKSRVPRLALMAHSPL